MMDGAEREEWICVDCWENPGDRGVRGYGNFEADGVEVCGYHSGVRKGYIDQSETDEKEDDFE